MQHKLPYRFPRTRYYGIHHPMTWKKIKDTVADTVKRIGITIRTVFQILKAMLGLTPYKCAKCGCEEFEIELIPQDNAWLMELIALRKGSPARSPPTAAPKNLTGTGN